MTVRRSAAMITAWLEDNGSEFLSQYGMTTHRQWLELEQKRIPGSVIVEKDGCIALKRK